MFEGSDFVKVFSNTKYDLVGFRRFSNGFGWVLTEIPKFSNQTPAYIIVSKAKFIDNGQVFFLLEDGSIESNHRVIQTPQLAVELL